MQIALQDPLSNITYYLNDCHVPITISHIATGQLWVRKTFLASNFMSDDKLLAAPVLLIFSGLLI